MNRRRRQTRQRTFGRLAALNAPHEHNALIAYRHRCREDDRARRRARQDRRALVRFSGALGIEVLPWQGDWLEHQVSAR